MNLTSVFFEIVLITCCFISNRHIEQRRYHKQRWCWTAWQLGIAICAALGAWRFATGHAMAIEMHQRSLDILVPFVVLNILFSFISALGTLDQYITPTSMLFGNCLIGFYVFTYNVYGSQMSASVLKALPIGVIITLAFLSASALAQSRLSPNRARAKWILIVVILFAVSEQIQPLGLALPPVVPQPVDLYHVVLALTVLCATNVATLSLIRL